MFRSTLLLLAVLLSTGAAAAPDKALDEAAAALDQAVARGTRSDLEAALDKLVALANPDGVSVIQAYFAGASQSLRERRDEIVQKTYQYERKREMLAAMEIRVERDPGLKEMVSTLKAETGELSRDLSELDVKVRAKERDVEAFGGATEKLFASFPSGALKKAAGALWKDALDNPEQGVRIAAVEMLGRVGGKGTATDLHKLLLDVQKDRIKLKKELPKLEQKLREFEVRYQRELDQNGGRASKATGEQYDMIRAEPAALHRELHKMAFLLDAAAEAGGRALVREQGADLEKVLKALIKAAQSTKGDARALTLDLLAWADSDLVRAQLRTLLAAEKEPLAQAETIDALARLHDAAAVPELLSTHLLAESWHVRSRAAAALAMLRSKPAIPVLIDRLEADEGRVKTDVQHALESLTTQRFGSNVNAWRRWWADNGAAFEVPAEPEKPAGSLSAEEAVGVTFFGIRTESQRVLFVLDVSGSMNFSMVPRNNPNDDMSRDPDMPQNGEDSRLQAAKRELVKALGGIGDGGVINIVLYATDVWSWRDDPVKIDTETKSEVIRYVEALTANGGTNIYGALKHALDVAGVKDDGEWSAPDVDTLYLLSDGRASVGLTQNSDEILSYVRERNETAGITIHTIGLSGAQDAYLLKSLAEQNGGQYVAK
jgi:HEAT repeat protein